MCGCYSPEIATHGGESTPRPTFPALLSMLIKRQLTANIDSLEKSVYVFFSPTTASYYMAGHTSMVVSGKSHTEASVVNIVGGQVTELPDGGRSGQWIPRLMKGLLLGAG